MAMQDSGPDGAPRGETAAEIQEPAEVQAAEESPASSGPAATNADDEWGKFYSMPPKWKKDDNQWNKDEHDHQKAGTGLTDENIGHKLISLLRYHLGGPTGIKTDENGWVVAADIVENGTEFGLGGVTVEDVIRVAENNTHSTRGKRFDSDGAGRIKATYRHPPKDRRDDRRGRDRRDGGWQGRDSRGNGRRGGYSDWQSNGWDDHSNGGKDYSSQDGGDSWSQWGKESKGFSPAPDDAIVKESTWTEAADKPTQVDDAVKPSQEAASKSDEKVECLWEQWFTPDSMEMYFYHTQTEEVFFPGDATDTEEKGWCRYVESEGEKKGKIYWWHEESSRSFFEEDAAGDAEAEN